MANPEMVRLTPRKPAGRFPVAEVEMAAERYPVIEVVAELLPDSTAYSRYRNLVDRVNDVFGDEAVASRWLSTPSIDFDSQPPIEVAKRSGYDVSALESVLIRIEHGVDF